MSAQPVNLTDALVFSYLQKRGYSAAAAALPPGAKLPAASDAERERAAAMASEMAVANRITLFEGADDYIGSYQRLRDWVHGSLDLYKVRYAAPFTLHTRALRLQATPAQRGTAAATGAATWRVPGCARVRRERVFRALP